MCATRSRRSSSDAHRDHDRNHQHPAVQASHLAPHPFYLPPPYARYPPYDPYAAYHCPGLFYPPPPCHVQRDVAKEETAVWSWPVILFLIFLVTVLIWIVYRNFSRENRRKLAAWLRLRRFQPQVISSLDYFDFAIYLVLQNYIRSDCMKEIGVANLNLSRFNYFT